jgi:iron complex transport system substrate-binding protein
MRILSFQPTSTEMVYALGRGRSIVGVSHECLWPPAARRKPVVSTCVFDPEKLSSLEIDRRVVAAARAGKSLYRLDEDLVRRLKPDLLLTQSLCDVCAVSPSDFGRVLRIVTPRPEVLSLHAHTLDGMFSDLRELAGAMEVDARPLERSLRKRIARVVSATRRLPRRRVFCMEWLDPVYASGHWVPELVDLAGGHDGLSRAGKPSRALPWSDVTDYAPEVLIIMACGFPIARTRKEMGAVTRRPGWAAIPAVRAQDVYLVDGPSFFNGAGPRLVEGLEILAEILHPEAFPPRRRSGYTKAIE